MTSEMVLGKSLLLTLLRTTAPTATFPAKGSPLASAWIILASR